MSCCWLAGLFAAVGALQQAAHPPVMNLRAVNPYVASALGDWGKAAAPEPTVPRLQGPMPDWSAERAAGTSSFGMSGTNAYGLVAPAGGAASTESTTELLWQRTRQVRLQQVVDCWHLLEFHAMYGRIELPVCNGALLRAEAAALLRRMCSCGAM